MPVLQDSLSSQLFLIGTKDDYNILIKNYSVIDHDSIWTVKTKVFNHFKQDIQM